MAQATTAVSSPDGASLALTKPVATGSDAGAGHPPASSTPAISEPAAPAAKSTMLLEALKEELFQLEVEKKQGKITSEDYEKARAALDHTLERALKRQA